MKKRKKRFNGEQVYCASAGKWVFPEATGPYKGKPICDYCTMNLTCGEEEKGRNHKKS